MSVKWESCNELVQNLQCKYTDLSGKFIMLRDLWTRVADGLHEGLGKLCRSSSSVGF